MTKLEQAARQVVDAWDLGEFSTRMDEAITALREALAEQERKAKYDERFERLEKFEQQAEQEPVAFQIICQRCKVDRVTTQCPNRGSVSDCPMTATAQNAAPVRTKDLTDEELWEAAKTAKSNDLTDAFRAVIQEFRRKNGIV